MLCGGAGSSPVVYLPCVGSWLRGALRGLLDSHLSVISKFCPVDWVRVLQEGVRGVMGAMFRVPSLLCGSSPMPF